MQPRTDARPQSRLPLGRKWRGRSDFGGYAGTWAAGAQLAFHGMTIFQPEVPCVQTAVATPPPPATAPAGPYPASPRPTGESRRIAHHFTVDLEEYFQVCALAPWVPRSSWDRRESRVREATARLLALLDDAGAAATFFVLGWTAARHRPLVRELAEAGHEIASHGWDHRRVTELTPDAFRESVNRTKSLLEDVTGAPVGGFRAPSFSIVPGYEWALDVLIEQGHTYDSSLFPIRRPGYGYRNGPRDPHPIQRGEGCILEVPPTTLRWCGMTLPAAGGGYLRLLPFSVVRPALLQSEARGQPGTFYIHPWELDPDQPRLPVSQVTRVRHYGGLARTADRVRRLLREFRFRPIRDFLLDPRAPS